MQETIKKELVEISHSRAQFYKFLAGIYFRELNDEQIETAAHASYVIDDSKMGAGYARIKEYFRHRDLGTRTELAVDYAHTFLGSGEFEKKMAPPYESVYTSEEGILMQEARDNALRCYREEGLDCGDDNTTPEDHISFELIYMSTLTERFIEALDESNDSRVEELLAKQETFLQEHLLNWVPLFCAGVRTISQNDFYLGMADVTEGYLELDAEVLADMLDLMVTKAA